VTDGVIDVGDQLFTWSCLIHSHVLSLGANAYTKNKGTQGSCIPLWHALNLPLQVPW
jgi:hypothetical protein